MANADKRMTPMEKIRFNLVRKLGLDGNMNANIYDPAKLVYTFEIISTDEKARARNLNPA